MEIFELTEKVVAQENIFTFLFIGLFIWQMLSHKKELDYYKNLVNTILEKINDDLDEIKNKLIK